MLSLKRIHHAGYYHTDIRLPNILKFEDNKYSLIDFGDAVKKGATVNINRFSQGRKSLVTDLVVTAVAVAAVENGANNVDYSHNSKTTAVLKWNRAYDVEMLLRAVFNAPAMMTDNPTEVDGGGGKKDEEEQQRKKKK